jgi:microcystin-dependent protein
MTDAPPIPRRHFLGRLLAAIAGGAWLGRLIPGRAEAATGALADLPYLGEIRMFGADWAPVGWAICDGSLLLISQYDPLFQLIGTTYGGDGVTTFGLPDLRGRAPVHVGTTLLGQTLGQEIVTVAPGQAPYHTHTLQGSSALGDSSDPTGRVPARNATGAPHYGASVDTYLASTTLTPAGASQAHNNMMPSLCISFIMCIEGGVFPNPN